MSTQKQGLVGELILGVANAGTKALGKAVTSLLESGQKALREGEKRVNQKRKQMIHDFEEAGIRLDDERLEEE